MNVLVIGAGGREHAIAWKIAQSPEVQHVFVAPGNAGTALEKKISNVNLSVLEIEKLALFAKEKAIALTIVGPEAPLAAGIVDYFSEQKLPCFGPSQAAAQLESSKAFCKNFLKENNLPTAAFSVFNNKKAALHYLKDQAFPLVIKASGLASGKGVIIAHTLKEAEETVESMLSGESFGQAGSEIIIEEFLKGEELSFIVLTDGETLLPLASTQDHKQRDEGDKGPNTGGMGAYSPAPILNDTLEAKILDTIIKPTLTGLKKQGITYTGFLYAGLMISAEGEPYVLEFNCRLGDPETQPLLLRLHTPLEQLCLAATQKRLCDFTSLSWDNRSALCVVLAAQGYPGSYQKGQALNTLSTHCPQEDTKVFHAGTTLKEGQVYSNGGRVLGVCALGSSLQEAQKNAYAETERLSTPSLFYRKDIGQKGIPS